MPDLPVRTVTVSAQMHLAHPAADIWPLLCPVREYDWIDIWKCEILHCVSGVNEVGCVFRTDFPAYGEEVWVTSRFEPVERLEFVRVSSGHAVRYVITLSPDGDGTRLIWTQHITSLDNKGVAAAATDEAFQALVATLEAMLGHYLDTGQMLTGRAAADR
jgi:hypothetical protein